ncbi:MAG: hypothetical protein ACT4OZ_16155 [Gemmatimonadota bacterium]
MSQPGFPNAAAVVLPMMQDAREISREVQREVRAPVTRAQEQVRDQEAEIAGARAAALAQQTSNQAIDLLRAEINGVKQEIAALMNQLDQNTTDAREAMLTDQIESATDRLENLQDRFDELISGETNTETGPPFVFTGDAIPPQAVDIAMMFFITIAAIAIGVPFARGFGRWAERRGAVDQTPRLDRIEQAIEAVAIEVERVAEGQRYSNKLLGDSRAIGGAGETAGGWGRPREAVPVERREA